ncbi:hypothetical protein T484DRAFT_1776246 [Baffinella frigidus]|nr:hypothetical protein T484DRAFT_1776246 [Cryptophyta sp. CCMP2293]
MRILLVLACGPGASTVYDTTEVDIARSKGGGAGRSVTAQVHRTVWAACAEAALEIARAVFELQPRGAQVAILLVGAGESGGKVVPVNGWGPKEQSLSKVFAGLELATCSDAPIDAAKAGEAAGHMATDALPARGAGAGGSSSSDCRILFISSPEAVGVTVGEAGGAAARVAAAVEQASALNFLLQSHRGLLRFLDTTLNLL